MSEFSNFTDAAFFANETTMYPNMGEEEDSFLKYAWWQYFIIPWVAGECVATRGVA